jgi:hypothetical protein
MKISHDELLQSRAELDALSDLQNYQNCLASRMIYGGFR